VRRDCDDLSEKWRMFRDDLEVRRCCDDLSEKRDDF